MGKKDTFFSKIFFFFLILFLFNGNIINNQKVLATLINWEIVENVDLGKPIWLIADEDLPLEERCKFLTLIYEVLPMEDAIKFFPDVWLEEMGDEGISFFEALEMCGYQVDRTRSLHYVKEGSLLPEETYHPLVLPTSTLEIPSITYVPAPIREGEEILYQEHWPPFLPQKETIIPYETIVLPGTPLPTPTSSPTSSPIEESLPPYEQLVLLSSSEGYTQLVLPTTVLRPTPTFLIPFVVYYPAYKDVDYQGNVPIQRIDKSFGYWQKFCNGQILENPNCREIYQFREFSRYPTKVVEKGDKMYFYYFEPHSWFNAWKPVYWPVPSYVPYPYNPYAFPRFPICYVSPESDPRSPDYGQVHCVGQLMVLGEAIYERKEKYPGDPWPWEFYTSSLIMDYRKILEIMKDECQFEGLFKGSEPAFEEMFPSAESFETYWSYPWPNAAVFLKNLYEVLDPYDVISDEEQPRWDDVITVSTRFGTVTTTRETILGNREFWEKMFWQGEWWRWRNKDSFFTEYLFYSLEEKDYREERYDLRNYFDYKILDYLRAPVITCYNLLTTPTPTPLPPIKVLAFKAEEDPYDSSTRIVTLLSSEEIHPATRKCYPERIPAPYCLPYPQYYPFPVITSALNIYLVKVSCELFYNTPLFFDCLYTENTLYVDTLYSYVWTSYLFTASFNYLTETQKLRYSASSTFSTSSEWFIQNSNYWIWGYANVPYLKLSLAKDIPYNLSPNPIPWGEVYFPNANLYYVIANSDPSVSKYNIDCSSCDSPSFRCYFKPLADLVKRLGEQANRKKVEKNCNFDDFENNPPDPSELLNLSPISVKVFARSVFISGYTFPFGGGCVVEGIPRVNTFNEPLSEYYGLYQSPEAFGLGKIEIAFGLSVCGQCSVCRDDDDNCKEYYDNHLSCFKEIKSPEFECNYYKNRMGDCGCHYGSQVGYRTLLLTGFSKEIPVNISSQFFFSIPRVYFIFHQVLGTPIAFLHDGSIYVSLEAIVPSYSSYFPKDKFAHISLDWAPVRISRGSLSSLSGYFFEDDKLERRFLKKPSVSYYSQLVPGFNKNWYIDCAVCNNLEEAIFVDKYPAVGSFFSATDYEELGRCTLTSGIKEVYALIEYDEFFPSLLLDDREDVIALVEETTPQGISRKIMSRANECVMDLYNLITGWEFTYNPYDRTEACKYYLKYPRWPIIWPGEDEELYVELMKRYFLHLLIPSSSSEDPGCLVAGLGIVDKIDEFTGAPKPVFIFFAHEAPTLDKMNQDFLTYYDSEREGKKMGWGAPQKYYYFDTETGQIDRSLYNIYPSAFFPEYLTDKNFLFFYLFRRSPLIPEPTPTATILPAIMYYLRPVYLQGIEPVPP